MKMKTCFKCGIEKPLDDFYKHPAMADGHLNKCKECNKKDVRQNYRKNIKHYREYEKTRAMLPHRVAARDAYYKTEAGIESRKKTLARYAEKYPEKESAHRRTYAAILSGELIRESCQICGNKKVEAHHPDYSRPLDVIWLCSKCHHKWHKEVKMNEEKKKSLMELFAEQRQIAEQLETAENPAELMESLDKAVQVKAAGIAIYLERLDSMTAALEETIKKLQARKKAFQNRKERLKEYTLVAMKQHDIQKIECPECTISIQENNPSVDDYEPKLIPAEYWKQPEPVLDKKALLDDLKAGVIVQGARLKQTEGIRIR